MSLLGIDVGTTGCKSILFGVNGELLAQSYAEYDIEEPRPGYAELNAPEVWERIAETIKESAAHAAPGDPITAMAAASLGEAVVPVNRERRILASSILNVDSRGEEYLSRVSAAIGAEELYELNGNTLSNQYTITKLMWIAEHQPGLYEETYKFLHWGSFVGFMLGAEPAIDYSLANRSLLFDIDSCTWSDRLLRVAGIDREKLPRCVPPGTVIGEVSKDAAARLGLPAGASIVSGAHDQCANSLGAGAVEDGSALYGMGTFPTIAPSFVDRKEPARMIELGLNTEHHAIPHRYISFIYHMGGTGTKWFRDTFAAADAREAAEAGDDVYARLIAEMPDEPAPTLVLPHFAPMGPPDFVSDSAGVLLGLRLHTERGAILRGIMEGNVFALKLVVERLAGADIGLYRLRGVGGGSRERRSVQISADILNLPIDRPAVSEAGALGAALLAGMGTGLYKTADEAVETTVSIGDTIEPDPHRNARYERIFQYFKELRSLLLDFTRRWSHREL